MLIATETGNTQSRIIDVLMGISCEILRDFNNATSAMNQRIHWLYNTFLDIDAKNISDLNTMALHWTAMVMGLSTIYVQFNLYNSDGLTYWSYGGLEGHDLVLTNIGG